MGIFVWTSNMNPKPVKFCGAQKNTRKRNPVHWRPSSEICWAFAVPLSMRVRISETEAELPPSLVFCSGLFFILVIRTFWSLWECIIESMLAEYLWWTCILASFLDSFFYFSYQEEIQYNHIFSLHSALIFLYFLVFVKTRDQYTLSVNFLIYLM